MASKIAGSPMEEKHQIVHDEISPYQDELKEKDIGHEGLYKSRFDELSIWQALWTFRRSSFFTFIIYTAYIIDG